jgi:hypothetical protein
MPLSRHLLFAPLVFFAISVSAQTTTPAAVKDPQALAVVQAAISAMGGQSLINSAKNWDFQAQGDGPVASGAVRASLASVKARQQATPPPGGPPIVDVSKLPSYARPRSSFVPALVGLILLNQSQDPAFSLEIRAPTVADGQGTSSVVVFSVMTNVGKMPAQIWAFNSANLPVRVQFVLPAKIGDMESYQGIVELSDYRSVGGVLHPFRIVTTLRHGPPQVLTLQSVTPSTASQAGGAQ